jgi:uncharacterized protein YllA (UPF0747 family)
MTIDEAIERSNRIAEKNEELHKTTHPAFRLFDYEKCAKESRQLAEWLKELKALKEQTDTLNKIRAEIDGLLNDEDSNMYAQGVMDCLEIIDKYKAESEVQDADSD